VDLDEFVAAELREQPTFATQLGYDGLDDQLPDLSAEAFGRRDEADDAWASRFASFQDAELSLDEQIDRDLVLSTLRGRQAVRAWASWRRSPDTYLSPGLSGVFALFLHRLHPEADLAAFAAARLRAVPALLDAGRTNLDPELANPLMVRRSLGQARAGIAYARSLVPAEVSAGPLRESLAEAGEVAAVAYESFAAWLEGLAERATGPYAIGEELYSTLLEEREGLGYGARELQERGRAAYEELAADMRRRTRALAGHDDWRAYVEELNDDHPQSPEAMREAYEDWTRRSREFCRDRDLVTLPDGEECLVEPSPPFQRPVLAVASYMFPPAFKAGRVGHFFVPYPPEGTSAAEIQQRLATNSFSAIPTISVHEAYPGHHWHLTVVGDSPRPVRKILGTPYFSEGWGLYSEEMMKQEGFFTDPRHELAQVDARLFRAARIVVDTSLHLGDIDVEEAVEFMSTKASLSEPTARAEVARYCAWPTQAASYLTGSLEIERIRDRWFADGRGTLREFHDTIAATGMLPIHLAERATLTAV
jgi:uncharacterized protein (DUF885 family)